METKRFARKAEQISALVTGRGACFSTNKITVDGLLVGYMYREEADFESDSGWRFMAGNESKEYLDLADKLGIYDVNTIANYDPEIIPFLDASVGSAFERDRQTGRFTKLASDNTNKPVN